MEIGGRGCGKAANRQRKREDNVMIPSNVHVVWWGDEGLEKREDEARDDSEAEYLQVHC
jgi:hypothetical protein